VCSNLGAHSRSPTPTFLLGIRAQLHRHTEKAHFSLSLSLSLRFVIDWESCVSQNQQWPVWSSIQLFGIDASKLLYSASRNRRVSGIERFTQTQVYADESSIMLKNIIFAPKFVTSESKTGYGKSQLKANLWESLRNRTIRVAAKNPFI